jgi:SAM-dependent methyltransferase
VSRLRVPTIPELHALRAEGREVGYRGIYIYLRYRAVIAALLDAGIARPGRVLVVGSGYGIFERLLPPDVELTGIDVAADEVAFAAAWAARHRPGWRYRAQPLADCAFPARHFDLVILSEVIEHIPEPDLPALHAEIRRILAPGGHLLLSVPNRLTLRNRARRLVGRPLVLMDRTHLREYSLAEARAAAAATGLREEAFRAAVLYFPYEPRVARVLAPESALRERLARAAPALASHFVFVLGAPAG